MVSTHSARGDPEPHFQTWDSSFSNEADGFFGFLAIKSGQEVPQERMTERQFTWMAQLATSPLRQRPKMRWEVMA